MNRKVSKASKLLIPCAGLLLGACLSPREDPTRFFVLAAAGEGAAVAAESAAATEPAAAPAHAAAPAPSAAKAAPTRLLVVGPLRMPDYLLRSELVRRAGPNQLLPSKVDRWAEPIDRAALRVLCLDLAARLPAVRVAAFPVQVGEPEAAAIDVLITAFEADAEGLARLQGSWLLRGADGQASGGRHEFRLERAAERAEEDEPAETAAVVAAMSALIDDLAGEIGSAAGVAAH